MSDGCTGFWVFEWFFHISACCSVHDAGGTDGTLLDCLMQNTPHWAWPVVALCVAVMVLFRPVYNLIKSVLTTDKKDTTT